MVIWPISAEPWLSSTRPPFTASVFARVRFDDASAASEPRPRKSEPYSCSVRLARLTLDALSMTSEKSCMVMAAFDASSAVPAPLKFNVPGIGHDCGAVDREHTAILQRHIGAAFQTQGEILFDGPFGAGAFDRDISFAVSFRADNAGVIAVAGVARDGGAVCDRQTAVRI